jgi:hypothetical protein
MKPEMKKRFPSMYMDDIKFIASIANSVSFAEDSSGSAFYFDRNKRHITFYNEGFRIFRKFVLDQASLNKYPDEDIEAILYLADIAYFLHEITHIIQNIFDFDLVQKIKKTGGTERLGQIDHNADIRSAALFSIILSVTVGNTSAREITMLQFQKVLTFVNRFAPGAFGLATEAIHKKKRHFCNALVLNRVNRALNENRINEYDSFHNLEYPWWLDFNKNEKIAHFYTFYPVIRMPLLIDTLFDDFFEIMDDRVNLKWEAVTYYLNELIQKLKNEDQRLACL